VTLAEATAVAETGGGSYSGEIQPGWDIMSNANGGYLLSIAARAAAHAADRPDPVSVTAHYLRPGKVGPVSIETDLLRSGRRFSVVRSTMAADKTLVAVLGTYGTLEPSESVERLESGPPDLPPPEECTPIPRRLWGESRSGLTQPTRCLQQGTRAAGRTFRDGSGCATTNPSTRWLSWWPLMRFPPPSSTPISRLHGPPPSSSLPTSGLDPSRDGSAAPLRRVS